MHMALRRSQAQAGALVRRKMVRSSHIIMHPCTVLFLLTGQWAGTVGDGHSTSGIRNLQRALQTPLSQKLEMEVGE